MRILVVEDEVDMANALARGLTTQGYAVDTASTGLEGVGLGTVYDYDLAILDLNLPDMDGLEVCQQLRTEKPELPILILTARERIEDKVLGLDLCADDYLVKPFHFDELTARIRAILRREFRERTPSLIAGDLKLDPVSRTAQLGKKELSLTRKEFGILHYLMRYPGRVVSQEELIEHVWNERVNIFSNSIRIHIHSLRKKLGDNANNPQYIETVIGQGYRLLKTSITNSHENTDEIS
ncbi:MAG: DNA-binding response regulator [Chloroflexota bacterium]|nr:MAG: DNA-binding response regulator [Chloroflexota bacterium]HDD56222.1 response regulator transcription factor [Chloroflexota bacterium]